MKTIAYYISDYGYGHASRSIAVIRELLKEPEIKIIVCHSFALSFLMKSLDSNRVSFRNVKTDVGYILEKDSIHPDKLQLLEEYKEFVSNWQYRVQQEREFLAINNVNLVIADISPLPFEAAERLGIPSVGISNFTWYTAYQGLINDKDLKTFKDAYQKMTCFFSLAGSQENGCVHAKHYGFFSREVNWKEVNRIRKVINQNKDRNIIFFGLGMKIEVDSLEQLPVWDSPNCTFIVSTNVELNLPNVFHIPVDYLESQNFIAAADLVISKAGWGMVGEAVSANVPLLILDRPTMTEDRNTINFLKEQQLCETIDWEAFKSFQVYSSILQTKMNNDTFNNNEAGIIAADLLKIIYKQ